MILHCHMMTHAFIYERKMLYIKNEIEYLLKLIETPPIDARNDLYFRMYAWSILTMFNKVNQELEEINTQLDTSLNLDAVSLDFDNFYDHNFWDSIRFFQKLKKREEPEENRTEINRMTDYLPNGEKDYLVTPEVLDSYKTAMHQLCDEDKISSSALMYALSKGYSNLRRLLSEIRTKVMNPKPHLYKKLWEDELSKHMGNEYVTSYNSWMQDEREPSLEQLKSRQKQIIFQFLNTGFFRFCNMPTGSDVKKCKLKINEDDLEYGTPIPNDFPIECARFEKFFEWKENHIIVLNYEKLGQYIYKNYNKIDGYDLSHVNDFDRTMELIHEDMAKLKPSLAKYLKRYRENQDEELLNDCKKIFAPFKAYLQDSLRQTLIDEYLEKLLFDSDLKEEAIKNLRGQSIKKFCCSIVLALSYCNIFKPKYNNSNIDLGAALNTGLDWHNKDTFIRYLKKPEINSKALRSWTSNIMDELKEHPFTRTKTG